MNGPDRLLLVAGCGYVGCRLASQALDAGWKVLAWTRSGSATPEGFQTEAVDLSDADSVGRVAGRISSPHVVVHCASSGGGGATDYRRVFLDGARHLISAFPGSKIIFAGSTSVFAQTGGETVDESSPAAPVRETGRILLETEEKILGAGGSVLRLAGIYGPGRSAILRKLRDGTAALDDDGSKWVNQIHRDDAASALLFVSALEERGIFIGCDIHPMRQRDLFKALCARFDFPFPLSAPPDPNRKRGWSNKRLDALKLVSAGWFPRYRSFLDWCDSVPDTEKGVVV